jgi:hypothetical protein
MSLLYNLTLLTYAFPCLSLITGLRKCGYCHSTPSVCWCLCIKKGEGNRGGFLVVFIFILFIFVSF